MIKKLKRSVIHNENGKISYLELLEIVDIFTTKRRGFVQRLKTVLGVLVDTFSFFDIFNPNPTTFSSLLSFEFF